MSNQESKDRIAGRRQTQDSTLPGRQIELGKTREEVIEQLMRIALEIADLAAERARNA